MNVGSTADRTVPGTTLVLGPQIRRPCQGFDHAVDRSRRIGIPGAKESPINAHIGPAKVKS